MFAGMNGMEHPKLERRIAVARAVIGFERIWAALLWPIVIVCLGLALVFSGLLPWLPAPARLAALALMAVVLLWSLRPLTGIAWPRRAEAMRRIELSSGLAHRPVSAAEDRLAADGDGPQQQAIWREHKLRQLRLLDRLSVGAPRSAWRDLDGAALRLPAGLLLLASLLLGPGGPAASLSDALRLARAAAMASLTLDAWVKPPAYTGKPPLMLTSPAMVEKLKKEPEILVPENAVLTLRLNGAADPKLKFQDIAASSAEAPEIKGVVSDSKRGKDLFQSDIKLTRPTLVRVMDGTNEIAAWRIMLIPDAPPSAAITDEPTADSSGTLTVKWKVTDDYGVTGIAAEISLSDNQDGGIGIDGNGIFLYDPPKFPIALRKASPKEEVSSTSADLAEHPWAGFMVEMVLTASDAAGHTGQSQTRVFRLPERLFIKPLAKALIEQRRHLIMKPDEQGQVEQMLEALLAYPDGLIEGSGTYLAIATIISRLKGAASQDDVDVAVNLLWQTASGIEDGSMADAKAELEALRKELEKALAEGAPPERIAELMDKMRSAMDRYMQSLMQESNKRMRQAKPGQGQPQQPGRTVTPEELRKMLDTIEKLAQSGANDAAKQMLSQLDEILRNLKPGDQQGQMQSQSGRALSKMLDQLSELMRKQQRLMDDTQRMQQQGDGELTDPQGQEPGNNGQRLSPDGLAGQQQNLNGMLQELMRQLGQNGLDAPPTLGEAGKNMQGAEGSLRRQDREGALNQQGEAMNKLREGAQGMARQLMQQGQGQQGNYGRNGPARGDDRDPLGRPMPNHAEDAGPDRNMLPSELAIRRAREILDMLRQRASEPRLPEGERGYIDRLLRDLY